MLAQAAVEHLKVKWRKISPNLNVCNGFANSRRQVRFNFRSSQHLERNVLREAQRFQRFLKATSACSFLIFEVHQLSGAMFSVKPNVLNGFCKTFRSAFSRG